MYGGKGVGLRQPRPRRYPLGHALRTYDQAWQPGMGAAGSRHETRRHQRAQNPPEQHNGGKQAQGIPVAEQAWHTHDVKVYYAANTGIPTRHDVP